MDDFGKSLIDQAKAVRGYAMGLAKNSADADDLMQDTLMRAFERQNQFEPGTNLRGWLFTICRNRFLERHKRASRTVLFADDVFASLLMSSSDQHAALEAKDAISFIVDLPPAHQAALIDAGLGKTVEDIAAERGLSTGTVKSRLNRARTDLAAMLGEDRRLLKQGRRAAI